MKNPISIHFFGEHYVDADEIVSVYRDEYTVIVLKNGCKLGCFESAEEIMRLIRQSNNGNNITAICGRGSL